MVRATDDFPRIAVIIHMTAPGQRLEPDAQSALGGTFAEFREILCGTVDAAQSLGVDRRADQHQIHAERLHQVELSFRPVEGLVPQRLG